MPPDKIVEAVDVSRHSAFGLFPGLPSDGPDQFGFDGFEESLDGGVDAPMSVKLIFDQDCDVAFDRGD